MTEVAYCTYGDVTARCHPEFLARSGAPPESIVSPPPYPPPDAAAVSAAIADACALIDGELAARYEVPFAAAPASPPLIRALAAMLAACNMGRRWPGQLNGDAWRKDRSEAMALLAALRRGAVTLPGIAAKDRPAEAVARRLPRDVMRTDENDGMIGRIE